MSTSTAHRVEVKHSVPNGLAAEALGWTRLFLPPDRGISGPQRVTSLYLDSPELTFFRWQCEGRSHRFKLRVRRYGDWVSDQMFAEVKHKMGDVGRKTRAGLPASMLPALVAGEDVGGAARESNPALDDFVARRRAYAATPTLFISCFREARREPGIGDEVAVTVDTHVVYQHADERAPAPDPGAWRAMRLPSRGVQRSLRAAVTEGPDAIVEVKYTGQAPTWLATLLRGLSGHRVSFSKYVAGVRQASRWKLL